MTEARFIAKHGEAWKELESALSKKPQDFGQIQSRSVLYRAVCGHLSYAQTYYPRSSLCAYLGKLTAITHADIYAASTEKRSLRRFFRHTLPGILAVNRRFIAAASGFFILAAMVGFGMALWSPSAALSFLPQQFQSVTGDIQSGAVDIMHSVVSSQIMINNIYVAVLAFALGLTCCAGTVYVLVYNGFMLGALAGIFAAKGNALIFWSLILPHGVWELCAIFIAGGAGLRIGYSLLRPGMFKRTDALITAARSAVGLIGMTAVMLVVAGLIEGFFTPADVPPVAKLVFAALTAVPLILYACIPARMAK